MAGEFREFRAISWDPAAGAREVRLSLIEEREFTIYLEGRRYRTFAMTPGMEREFVFGHLFSSGLISGPDDVAEVEMFPLGARVRLRTGLGESPEREEAPVLESGCAVYMPPPDSRVRSEARFDPQVLLSIPRLLATSRAYARTRGAHSAVLADGRGEMVGFAEDVGRHNAVDKLIGWGLLAGVDMSDKLLGVSGRASSDIVSKAARANVPVVASLSAPTSLAVDYAVRADLTLVWILGAGVRIFSSPRRIS